MTDDTDDTDDGAEPSDGEEHTDGAERDDTGTEPDEPSDGAERSDTRTEPDEQRLKELGDHIAQARSQAEDVIVAPEEKYYESGDAQAESQDDQTITPPG